MVIAVDPNPNCALYGFFSFEELGPPKLVKAIQLTGKDGNELWDVTGVDEGGVWVPASARKVSDSGAAFGFLVFGGSWGIRLKRTEDKEVWNLQSLSQKGEAYLIYADETGLVYS